MAMNRIQFQAGMSMPVFFRLYGTEPQCEAALFQSRWPSGFCCPRCGPARVKVVVASVMQPTVECCERPNACL